MLLMSCDVLRLAILPLVFNRVAPGVMITYSLGFLVCVITLREVLVLTNVDLSLAKGKMCGNSDIEWYIEM